MAEIVNLRQARKRAARRHDEARAADNRVAFGLTKAEKRNAAIERARAEAALDGRRLAPADAAGAKDAEDRDPAR